MRPIIRQIPKPCSRAVYGRIFRRNAICLTSDVNSTSVADHWTFEEVLDTSKCSDWADKDLRVQGYVQSIRVMSKAAFAAIRDGSSMKTLQAVLTRDQVKELSVGCAVTLQGRWAKSRQQNVQTHELQVSTVQVMGSNDASNNPLQNKAQTAAFLRTIPHLRPRTLSNALLLRFRAKAMSECRMQMSWNGYVETHPPIITSSDCEGAGEVFSITSPDNSNATKSSSARTSAPDRFFKDTKYLTVSAQLHLEALVHSLQKVWCLSPTFRAERSDTPRHLSEFYMLEVERAFVDDLEIIMLDVEELIRWVVKQSTSLRDELVERLSHGMTNSEDSSEHQVVDAATLQRRWDGMCRSNRWPRITYDEAHSILSADVKVGLVTFQHTPRYEDGLAAEHERYIAEKVGQGSPVFVTHYPKSLKPFYMAPSNYSSTKTVACFDLLVPEIGELVGGSLREHRLEHLMEVMKERNLLPDGQTKSNLDWYLDLRRYGSVPHGGYGLGFDRLLCYLAGVQNIRDMVTFPRWAGRCDL